MSTTTVVRTTVVRTPSYTSVSMEVAIVGFAGCAFHESAIKAAESAGIKAQVTTVADHEAFKQFLLSPDAIAAIGKRNHTTWSV